MAIQRSQPSCQPPPIPVPASIPVCKAPTIADDTIIFSFIESTQRQLEDHISSLEMIATLSEQLVVAVTKAQAARTAAETELAAVIEHTQV